MESIPAQPIVLKGRRLLVLDMHGLRSRVIRLSIPETLYAEAQTTAAAMGMSLSLWIALSLESAARHPPGQELLSVLRPS